MFGFAGGVKAELVLAECFGTLEDRKIVFGLDIDPDEKALAIVDALAFGNDFFASVPLNVSFFDERTPRVGRVVRGARIPKIPGYP